MRNPDRSTIHCEPSRPTDAAAFLLSSSFDCSSMNSDTVTVFCSIKGRGHCHVPVLGQVHRSGVARVLQLLDV